MLSKTHDELDAVRLEHEVNLHKAIIVTTYEQHKAKAMQLQASLYLQHKHEECHRRRRRRRRPCPYHCQLIG